ncbi:MAG: hypothetical protein VB778_00810 [Nitrospinaceae bacterium]
MKIFGDLIQRLYGVPYRRLFPNGLVYYPFSLPKFFMANRISLNRLAETLIQESKTPFNTKDFAKHLESRWQKKVSGSAMKRLEKVLYNHSSLIGILESNFIPFCVVIDKIFHMSLSVKLGAWELKQGVLIPGHRLIPFVPINMQESKLTFLDPEGEEISKLKKSYYIQDIVPFYQYSANFPEEIKINEWIPGKSRMTVTVWDMRSLYRKFSFRPGDALLINLVDYEKGIYQVRPYSSQQYRLDRLRMRALYLALATQMKPLFQDKKFCSAKLEKQLLRVLFSINSDVFKEVEVFSVTEFLESLKDWAVVGCETGGVQMVPVWQTEPRPFIRSNANLSKKGEMGSLEKIFQNLQLAFDVVEFKSMLYTVMASDKYKLEAVFSLLFGGQGDLFQDKKQHEVFYGHLRDLLFKIYEDHKTCESRLVASLRERCVDTKFSLIRILRFLEDQEVGLEDLPTDLLNQIIELDHFCAEALHQFAERGHPPDLKFIREVRVALKVVLPQLATVEEEVYSRLAIY